MLESITDGQWLLSFMIIAFAAFASLAFIAGFLAAVHREFRAMRGVMERDAFNQYRREQKPSPWSGQR